MHGNTSGGPPDVDDDKEEDDNEVEDNNEVDDNDNDDNNYKDISALELDRDLDFSQGHQTKSTYTIPNQSRPTKSNQTKLAQIRANLCRFVQTLADSRKLV